MLYIEKPKQSKIEEFYNRLIDRVLIAKSNSSISNDSKDFLTKEKIKEIICDEPDKLLRHHIDFLPTLGSSFNTKYYNDYLKIKKKLVENRSSEENLHYSHCSSIINEIKGIFNYEKFISGHKITSYWLSEQLLRNTCTYCNRLYTNHVVYKDPETGRINNSTRLTKPFFDHWFSKSKYPILALSFYNLIPSCSVCNSSVKLDQDFTLKTHVHPYLKESDQEFSFDYNMKNVHKNNIKVIPVTGIGDSGKPKGEKIAKTLKDFKINEIYNAHSEFELKDLLELRYKYPDNYLNTLFSKTFILDAKKEEMYRLIFGVEYDEINHHKRPFSKFKRDILEKLGVHLDISKL